MVKSEILVKVPGIFRNVYLQVCWNINMQVYFGHQHRYTQREFNNCGIQKTLFKYINVVEIIINDAVNK